MLFTLGGEKLSAGKQAFGDVYSGLLQLENFFKNPQRLPF